MRKTFSILTFCSILFVTNNASAQLGGLLKKAKDKVKTTPSTPTTPTTPSTPTPTSETNPTSGSSKPSTESPTSTPKQEKEVMFEYAADDKNNVQADPALFAFQDKYNGKIVFAKEKLSKEKTAESIFTNQFNMGDAIYGRVFIKNPVYNYPIYYGNPSASRNDRHSWFIEVTINNDTKKIKVLASGDNKQPKFKGWTTWQIFPYAKGEDAVENKEWFVEKLNSLPDGNHTFLLELYGGISDIANTSKPIAQGSFTLTKTGGKKIGLGRNWGGYTSKMKNPELEKQMVEAMKAKANKEGWKEDFSKAKITVAEWNVVKNTYTGEKLYRTIEGVVYAKWPDGHCTVQEFSFSQDWKGTAFSKTLSCSGIGSQTTIDCE